MKFEPSLAAFKYASQSIEVLRHSRGRIWLLLNDARYAINVLSFSPR
jgi:hypothetical protein